MTLQLAYVIRELPPFPGTGGIGSCVWDISREAVKAGHRVTVICASADTRAGGETCVEGVRVMRLPGGDFAFAGHEWLGRTPIGRHWREKMRFWSYRQRVADCLNELIDRGQVDLVEFADFGDEGAVWLRRPRRIPAVCRCHHCPNDTEKLFARRTPTCRPWTWLQYRRTRQMWSSMASADLLTAPSKYLASWCEQNLPLKCKSVTVIPGFVDAMYWSQPPAAEATEDVVEPAVFFAGSVAWHKGVYELTEAVATLRARRRRLHLTLAGTVGEAGRRIRDRFAPSHSDEPWLTLTGKLPREQLRRHYTRAAVVCLPSWRENFPCTVLEALACGALVVASSVGGVPEMIRDGVDGLLVAPRAPAALARTLAEALDMGDAARRAMRQSARQRVRSSFDAPVVVPRMLEFYRHVIERFRAGKRVVV